MPGRAENSMRSLILTGASGFIGGAFLRRARERYRVFALARRSRTEADVEDHPNVEWMTVDITDAEGLRETFQQIHSEGPIDFVVHLAGYYDFENTDDPQYERTNVDGTRNILTCSRELGIERFVFASSLIVSKFPSAGQHLTEQSPPDATFPYARSKRHAEELVREFSNDFPCSVVRLAATFSDWCEYGPFYMLLMTWLSDRWNSRVLAGQGEASQPFVHVDHVVRFLLEILARSEQLPNLDTYAVASDEIYSHRQLFELATRLCYGEAVKPILLPKLLATFGVVFRDLFGRIRGERPFERLWMMRYVDAQLRADTSYSRSQIPVPYKKRLSLERRFPYMLENMLSHPAEWERRNIALIQRRPAPPNLLIAGVMLDQKSELVNVVLTKTASLTMHALLPRHQAMRRADLRRAIELIYELLVSTVRRRDRMPLLNYARYLAELRKDQGFRFSEMRVFFELVGETLFQSLQRIPAFQSHQQVLVDVLRLTTAMVIDQIEAVYDAEVSPETSGQRSGDDEWPAMREMRFLRSVLDSIEQPVVIIDLAHRVRMMNRNGDALRANQTSAPSGELRCYHVGHSLDAPCSGDDHPCPMREVLQKRKAIRAVHTHRDRGGSSTKVAVLASPLFGKGDEVVGIIETTQPL